MNYKRGLAVVIGCVIAALVAYAATWPRFHPASVSAPVAGASAPATASASDSPLSSIPLVAPHGNPLAWNRLTDTQRAALAPFATKWDHFSDARKRKWLKIAERYPKLTPDAQMRLHERMAQWLGMTPEQRRVARENYEESKRLPPQARQKAWTAYQQLPEEQKERLAAIERSKRRPTIVSAPPGGKSEVHDIERLVNERDNRHGGARLGGGAPASAPTAAVVPRPASPVAAVSSVAPAPAETPATHAPAAPAPASAVRTPDMSVYRGS